MALGSASAHIGSNGIEQIHKATTKLLVSVREPSEVEAAIAGGADWLDLKEPRNGPLAAVSFNTAQQVVDRVDGRLPVSAALGELRDWHNSPAQKLLELSEIKVVKLGLSGCTKHEDWQSQWASAAEAITKSGHSLAAVAYADWQQADSPHPMDIIKLAASVGCRYFLIDTYNKQNGTLNRHLSYPELQKICIEARAASLKTLVAGSLEKADLEQLPLPNIDMVGVRGGVCQDDRTSQITQELVSRFKASLNEIVLR